MGLRERAKALHDQGKAVVLAPHCVGPTEMHAFLRGWRQYYLDFVLNPRLVESIMDRVVELKMAFWERALAEVGEYVDVVMEADDVAGQDRMLISPDTFRTVLKPRYERLFSAIKGKTRAKLFLHSCGAVREVLWDFIECGVDILNPVQKSATGMDLPELKRRYGAQLCFHGCISVQETMPFGTRDDVETEVITRIQTMGPGGGLILSPRLVQVDVPISNLVAFYDAAKKHGTYPIAIPT